uniref:HECT domain-containing protein n=1 Tax=Knipowitschia caucasica TaxID=637954 RepID=A0AAV2KTU4_KNICA
MTAAESSEFVKENIEMELFSSEERGVDHPLAQDPEEEPAWSCFSLGRGLSQPPPAERSPQRPIEMEVLCSLKTHRDKTVCEHRSRRLKWKKTPPPGSRFVVKDVTFVSREQYQAQMESQVFSQSGAVSPVRARMTVDQTWAAAEMDNRLRLVLRRQFGKAAAKSMHFTYLQSVQSSRCLFVPSAPEEGWSGVHVLRISALRPLHVLIHQDISLVQSEQLLSEPQKNRSDLCPTTDTNCRTQELGEELRRVLSAFTGESRGEEVPLLVRRSTALQSALRAVRRSNFCFRDTPLVSFSGEETEGHQGPQREFFRLMLQELRQSPLFEGPPGRLLFTSDLSSLEDWGYYEAGVLIGWSLAHGGEGPRCLHPALFQLMCGRSFSLDDFSWRDVVDFQVQSHLQQLQTCADVRCLSPALRDWIHRCGVPEVSGASTAELPDIYRRVVTHYIHDRVSGSVEQFTQGLSSCDGLWSWIKSHCRAFTPIMTSARSRPLTLQDFRALFTTSYSEVEEEKEEEEKDEENKVKEEKETVAHWDTVLGLISDGDAALTFEDLLVFVSGVKLVPPLGFPGLFRLLFYSQDPVSSAVRLPFASTCALELFLPLRVGGAVDLLRLLTRAVRESVGFTSLRPEKRTSLDTASA